MHYSFSNQEIDLWEIEELKRCKNDFLNLLQRVSKYLNAIQICPAYVLIFMGRSVRVRSFAFARQRDRI